MSRYEALLFLHVASVIVWLGTGTTLALATSLANRDRERLGIRQVAALAEWVGPRLFAPGALGALVFGILLVIDGSWTFGPLWVKIGLVGFAATFLTNGVLRTRALRRVDRDEVGAGRRLSLLARLDLTILYLVVAAMIAKPTGGDAWTLAIGGAILALVAASVAVGWRRTA